MSDTQKQTLAIEALVSTRCKALGLSPAALVRRCGYKNVTKGLRRLELLRAGDVTGSVGLIGMLPPALDVRFDVVKKAVEETQHYLQDSAEVAWRAAFRPHAVITTARERPQPLFIAAFIGVDVLLRVDFDLTASLVTFVRQSLDGIRKRSERWRGNSLPAFDAMTGIIVNVNFTPDLAVRFDLDGNAAEQYDQTYRIREVQLSIGGRALSHAELAAIFSGKYVT